MISLSLEECIKQHRFKELFIDDLGWDNFSSTQELEIQDGRIRLESVAEKRGLRVFCCKLHRTSLANRGLLRRIQKQLIRQHHEHIIVYHSDEPKKQVWQWAIHQADGRKVRYREHPFLSYAPPRPLIERLANLRFTLDEEECATIVDAMARTRQALDVIPEQELFARYPTFAKQSDELAVALRAGEPGAFSRFCEFHLRLAKKSSRMLYHWFGMDEDDAFQIACIGLVQAAKRFDPTRGYQFSTYASFWIRQSCQRYGPEAAFFIRFPNHIVWPLYRLQFSERQLLATYGLPTATHRHYRVCKSRGVPVRDWVTFDRVRNIQTFSDLEGDDWTSLRSAKDPGHSPMHRLLLKELRQNVMEAVALLNEREQNILHHRYGIGCAEHTLEEVAGIYGLTRERIRQIQARAEGKLQIYLAQLDPGRDSPTSDDLLEEPVTEEQIDASDSRDIETTAEPENLLQADNVAPTRDPDQNERPSNDPQPVPNSMTTWIFSPVSAASVRRDPNETELFKTEQAGEGEYSGTDALVREVIQNSLDAGHREEPVRVRFALHPSSDLPERDRLAHYFSRLEPALEFRDISFSEGVPHLHNGFLVCEDFGTSGLAGDPNLVTDPPKNSQDRQDFFWFWRNIGRSGKTGDDLGRWGLGKTVYRAASRVGCMFGLTVRKGDGRELLMGQAVLKIHRHNVSEYAPEGFWCSGAGANGTPLAIEAVEELDRFRYEWKLSRKHEPGLSVVVPYVAEELKAESLLRLVVVNFFLPIIKGELVVDVSGQLSGQRQEWRVDSSTISTICSELKWNGRVTLKLASAPPISFAKDCLKEATHCHQTKLLGESRVPSLDDLSFDEETLDIVRRKYLAEEIVAIKVKAVLPRKSGSPETGELLAFLQRTGSSDRYESYYVREGMTITKLNTKRSIRGVRGMVVVEPGSLASLLGDTEGPAHTTWDTSNDERPNRVWKTWKGRVTFFSNILDSLNELLTPKSSAPDFDLLSDFFSIEQAIGPQLNRRSKKHGEQGEKPPFSPPPPTPRWYRLNGRPGGFTIADSVTPPTEVGSILRVSVAYDLPSGNPMKAWSKFDFDFKDKNSRLQFTGNGVNVKAKAGNIMEIEVTKSDFQVTATGFDIHRDLFVRIDETAGDEETSET